MKTVIKDLDKIYSHFGSGVQRYKLREECREYLESMEDEEIADLAVLSCQFLLCEKQIRKLFFYKIRRTLQRMKENYYAAK